MARTLTEIDNDLLAAETLVDKHETTDIPARVSDHVDNVSRISSIESITADTRITNLENIDADNRIETLEAEQRNLTADYTSPNPGYIATPQDNDPNNLQRVMTNQFRIASNTANIGAVIDDMGTLGVTLATANSNISSIDSGLDSLRDDFDDLSAEFDAVPISQMAEISISSTCDTKDVQSSYTSYTWNLTLPSALYIVLFKVGSDREYCLSHFYTGAPSGHGTTVNKDYPPKYRNYDGTILGNVITYYNSGGALTMVTSARCIDDINIIKLYRY